MGSILAVLRVQRVQSTPRPCAFAMRAIPPRPACTSSPYRIGITVVFHRPACITEARSIFSAHILRRAHRDRVTAHVPHDAEIIMPEAVGGADLESAAHGRFRLRQSAAA